MTALKTGGVIVQNGRTTKAEEGLDWEAGCWGGACGTNGTWFVWCWSECCEFFSVGDVAVS